MTLVGTPLGRFLELPLVVALTTVMGFMMGAVLAFVTNLYFFAAFWLLNAQDSTPQHAILEGAILLGLMGFALGFVFHFAYPEARPFTGHLCPKSGDENSQ